MSQDNKKSFVMYQGDGSNNVFSVPMTKGKYGTISVAFVRRGLDQYEYNPDTWGLNGGLFAWDLSGTKVYTDTATPAIGATVYDQYGVDTGDTVTAVGGATITVNTNVYTRDTLHDVDENTVLTWTGDTLQVGDYIVIERTTTRTQPFEFQNNQKHIEKSDDNLERQIQEVADKVDNALSVDPTHTIDSNKMNPVEWMKTILRSVDKSVRGFRFLNGWLDYSLDDPNIADADKTWVHLLNTDNIKSIRERKEIKDGEEHCWVEYLDQNGQWKVLVDSNLDARIEEVERVAGEAKQIAEEAKGIADEAKEIAGGVDGKAQRALDNSEEAIEAADEAIETAEEAKEMIQNQIIVRSATMPTPSADLLGKAYQYAGTTNAQYTHNYIYECQTVENNTLAFTPNTVSCSWDNLSAFLSQQTPDYNSVVKGTLTYIEGGDLWRLVAMDAEDNIVLSYQQYTGDWEGVGFTFAGTYEDGAVVSFERTTTTSYVWVRVNVQPDYTAEIQELETDVDNIQAVIPGQATPTNQLVTQNTTTQIQQQVNHLQTIGRFLSFWDATTGLAQTNPQTSPYIYQTGDYFRVGVVASGGGTNYKPSGSSYTIGVASTAVETEPLTEGQVYYYDGANWALAAGGNVAIDGTTIVFNSNNELQTVATVNQNTAAGATNPVYDWVGTLAEYQAQNIETLHPDWICYITDDVSGGDSVYTKAQVDTIANGKANVALDNVSANIDYVVEFQAPTAENNYTWYRKYKSGWVEQGGRTSNFTNTGQSTGESKTVILPIAMSDTYYTVNASLCSDLSLGNGSVFGWANRDIKPGIMTTTGFTMEQWANNASSGTSVIACWQVSGMAA